MTLNLPKLQKVMRVLWSLFAIVFLGVFLFVMNKVLSEGVSFEKALEITLAPIGHWMADKVFTSVTLMDISVEVIVIWMLLPMLFFSLYYGFINIRGFKASTDIIRGKYSDDTSPGDVSQVQALTTALSGTVGLGNIAGVAIAVAMGGPGATFWMFVISILAMAVKFSECTLAVKYRVINEDGTVSGGPMYYLYHGLKNRGLATLGAILAVTYAIFTLPSLLQIVQVNQAYSQFNAATGIDAKLLFGIGIAILTAFVIIGGIKSIAKVTVRLVPFMAGIYILAGLIIILANITLIPDAIFIIFKDAFAPEAVGGGIIGVIVVGMRRAVYSTEAGLGSSTIAHAAAKTKEPVSEGLVGLMEPFIDTIVGLVTALIIVITGAYLAEGLEDIQITSLAFESVFSWFPIVLAIAAFLFAFSTIISWSYYNEKVWTFLFGNTKRSVIAYKSVFCIMLIPGAVIPTASVVDIMDSLFFMLAVPNIIGLYIMAPELRADLKDYMSRLKSGKIPLAKKG